MVRKSSQLENSSKLTMQVKALTIANLRILNLWTRLTDCGGYNRIACAIGYGTSWYLMMGVNITVSAQSTTESSTPEICDVNLTLLKPTEIGADPNIVTADTVSPKGTTIPSLWWTSEQLPAQLVTNWIANRRQNQIYLLVNTQYWNILDYVDRYQTIQKFGRVAHSYGYNLKVCNSQKIALARYTCEVTDESRNPKNSNQATSQPNCQIWLNGNDRNGMGIQSR
jgi:hypothetical protein